VQGQAPATGTVRTRENLTHKYPQNSRYKYPQRLHWR